MKRWLQVVALACVAMGATAVPAQQVQWASKVLEVSSEYRDAGLPGQWAAREALGEPSCVPSLSTIATECAWSPSDPDIAKEEYIKLGYAEAQRVQQVAISEPFGAGTVTKVILFDTKGAYHLVYENTSPRAAATPGRMLNVFFPLTTYDVKAVMVVLRPDAVAGIQEIDAVGISRDKDSVKAGINLAPGVLTDGTRENLGPNVNSQWEELLPVISPDGKTLYITRQGHPENLVVADNQDIWYSNINPDGTFSPAKNIGAPLNNGENNATAAITPDGNTMMLLNKYLPNGTMEKGVSLTRRGPEGWQAPIGCEIKNFYNDNLYGEYCLSASGKVMVMTMQRKDSRGGKDLYVSFLQPDDTWSEPLSMGDSLNTAAGESTPFLANDESTLYFSTNGLPGYGRKDMYITRRLDSTWTHWSKPQNLGPLLNTPAWDAYYSIPASGDYAYFVSYQNSIGGADIFRAPLPASVRPKPVVLVTGIVRNAKTNEPMAAKITYESLTSGKELGFAHSDAKTGFYSIVLPPGEEYGFLGEQKEFFPVSENLDLRNLAQYAELKRDLSLVPLEKGNVARLNNLFFDSGKADLRPQSTRELNRLVKTMEEHPAMVIEIVGHTDDVGNDAYNLSLSQRRAAMVLNYLKTKGIAPARLKSTGYGESKPQVPNDSPENQQRNRRVEFAILSL